MTNTCPEVLRAAPKQRQLVTHTHPSVRLELRKSVICQNFRSLPLWGVCACVCVCVHVCVCDVCVCVCVRAQVSLSAAASWPSVPLHGSRSEERRVGKACRSRVSVSHFTTS